jgi:hypothetical protein
MHQFALCNPWMFRGLAKPQQPGHNPEKTKATRKNESRAPAEMRCQNGNAESRDDYAHVRTAIEYSRRERSLLLGKPVGDSPDCCGKIRGLSGAKTEARHGK